MFGVDGVECEECPASLITQESIELLDMYARARRGHDAFGTTIFGPDLLQWPAWAVDLVQLCETERQRVDQAEQELENRGTSS